MKASFRAVRRLDLSALRRQRIRPDPRLFPRRRLDDAGEKEAGPTLLRITDPKVNRGATVTFWFDEHEIVAYEGETIAAAALAHGARTLRLARNGEARGVYCGMGVCFDCLVSVDGSPNQRACITPVRSDMRVTTHRASP